MNRQKRSPEEPPKVKVSKLDHIKKKYYMELVSDVPPHAKVFGLQKPIRRPRPNKGGRN